jgi:hypothetical protein
MSKLMNFLLRLVLLAVGLVFAASLAVAVVLLLAFWAVRAAWARLTGRPITPFVFRIDPRAGFGRVYRGRQSGPGPAPAPEPTRPGRRETSEVTDVEPKER